MRAAVETVCRAWAAWLERRRRQRLHAAIARYAEAEAGTPRDLDDALEDAGLESLDALSV